MRPPATPRTHAPENDADNADEENALKMILIDRASIRCFSKSDRCKLFEPEESEEPATTPTQWSMNVNVNSKYITSLIHLLILLKLLTSAITLAKWKQSIFRPMITTQTKLAAKSFQRIRISALNHLTSQFLKNPMRLRKCKQFWLLEEPVIAEIILPTLN